MDRSAIELIQQTAIGANNGRQERMPAGTIALPDNFKIHDLEEYLPQRSRFRGTFATSSIPDFAGYVTERGGEGFVDADKHSAVVFFNLGDKLDPGHGDHRAVLSLKKTAAYLALLTAAGGTVRFDQRQLVDWLEDWNPNLRAVGQLGEDVPLVAAIAAIRDMTIEKKSTTDSKVGDFNSSRGTLDEVDARSRLSLPAGFTFACEPFLGLPQRTFRLRLAVLTGGDKPALTLRIVQKEAEEEAIAQDFKTVLRAAIGDKASLTIGTFAP